MRLLAILGVVQTACLLLLIFLQIDARGDRPAELPGAADRAAASPVAISADAQPLEEARLRRVIRDELAAQAHRADTQSALAAKPRNALEDQLRRERVSRQLDYYKRLGRISSYQMQALQDEIAQLDPISRKAMLGSLVRSLNRGEIDGRF